MGQYAVDLVFQAIDQSQRGSASFIRQMESVDSAIKKVTTTAGEGRGGAVGAAGGSSVVDSLFAGIGKRFVAVAAFRLAIDGATIAIKQHEYAQARLVEPMTDVLKRQIDIRDSMKNLTRDIPFLGSAVTRLMEAWNKNDGLKRAFDLLEGVRKSTAAIFESAPGRAAKNKRQELENAGAPASVLLGFDIDEARKTREAEINAARKKVEEAQKSYKLTVKKEEQDFVNAIQERKMSHLPVVSSRPITINRTNSERIKNEDVKKAQDALRILEEENARGRRNEAAHRSKVYNEEGERVMAEQQKRLNQRNKERWDEFSWQRDQQQRVEELEAQRIKDRVEREKQAIEIKYKYEIQKAKEAFHDTSLLEEQRRLELAGVEKEKHTLFRPGNTAAEEVRYASGAYGGGQNYMSQTARHAGTQVELMQKMNRKFDELIQVVRGQPGVHLQTWNFS